MYTSTNITEKLNFFDISCDCIEVEQLIEELQLEPVYEDKKGLLYYDDEAYELIKNRLEEKISEQHSAKKAKVISKTKSSAKREKTSVALDKAGNIEIIAQTISKRITIDLAEYIKNNMSTEEAFKAGLFKRDNEILSRRLQDIINDNKKLIEKIHELEKENHKYRPVFGSFYIKDK